MKRQIYKWETEIYSDLSILLESSIIQKRASSPIQMSEWDLLLNDT